MSTLIPNLKRINSDTRIDRRNENDVFLYSHSPQGIRGVLVLLRIHNVCTPYFTEYSSHCESWRSVSMLNDSLLGLFDTRNKPSNPWP